MCQFKYQVLVRALWLSGFTILAAAQSATCAEPKLAGSESRTLPIRWETDYGHALDLANRQRKLLLIAFADPANALWKRFESETLSERGVRASMQDYVCARLPTDATITLDGKESKLLGHAAFQEMLGRPGIAILDFARQDPALHGYVVSAFPLTANLFYGPVEMAVILDLPSGTLTQRTLIYAVRIHPERPCSAAGPADSRLLAEAESHSECQARMLRQGHHFWSARFPRISALLGSSVREVCAESWPGQHLVEAALECVRSWRCSSGHWHAVCSSTQAFGYDMRLGTNGVWYATGVFACQ